MFTAEDLNHAKANARQKSVRQLSGPRLAELLRATTLRHDQELTFLATRGAIKTFGRDRLSGPHENALAYIACRLTDLATGEAQKFFKQEQVWLPYGLTCGGGKTLTAMCWMAAVHALGRPYLVCYAALEIEALCKLKQDLISFGVPADKIGILHSKPVNAELAGDGVHVSVASDTVEQAQLRQFLLCSHVLIQGGQKNLEKYNTYRIQTGPAETDYTLKDRSLVIYDETLLRSDVNAVSVEDIGHAQLRLATMKRNATKRETTILGQIQGYLDRCSKVITSAGPGTIRLPEVGDGHPVEDLMSTLRGRKGGWRQHMEAPGNLVLGAGRDVRVLGQNGHRCAWFLPRVPVDLRSVMILDASHSIRVLSRLVALQGNDQGAPADPGIRYPEMIIDWFTNPSGWETIRDECRVGRGRGWLANRIADWILELPADEPVLVWTFKNRSGIAREDPAEKLTEVLKIRGIDPAEKLTVIDPKTGEPACRVTIKTHGQGKGSNEFEHIPNVAFYGIFQPPWEVTEAHMLGQQLDLAADLSDTSAAHWSEIVHELFQEISRSAVRRIKNGIAGPGRVLLTAPRAYRKPVIGRLVDPDAHPIFPGATLRHREDLEHEDHNDAVASFRLMVAELVRADLRSRPREAVSTVKVLGKVRAQLPEGRSLTKIAWQRTRDVVLDAIHEIGWTMSDRSFVPVT